MTAAVANDIRYTSAICTPAEAGTLAGMPPTTVRSWMRAAHGRTPIVHSVGAPVRGWPTIPLVGVIETWSMRALRNAGVPMQKLRRAADQLKAEHGEYILSRPVLFTDGIDLYQQQRGDLFRIEDGQRPIEQVIQDYLARVQLDDAQDPQSFRVPLAPEIELVMDPRFNAGRLSFEKTRTPAFAVLGALQAGERPAYIADDYGISIEEVAAVDDNRELLEEIA